MYSKHLPDRITVTTTLSPQLTVTYTSNDVSLTKKAQNKVVIGPLTFYQYDAAIHQIRQADKWRTEINDVTQFRTSRLGYVDNKLLNEQGHYPIGHDTLKILRHIDTNDFNSCWANIYIGVEPVYSEIKCDLAINDRKTIRMNKNEISSILNSYDDSLLILRQRLASSPHHRHPSKVERQLCASCSFLHFGPRTYVNLAQQADDHDMTNFNNVCARAWKNAQTNKAGEKTVHIILTSIKAPTQADKYVYYADKQEHMRKRR